LIGLALLVAAWPPDAIAQRDTLTPEQVFNLRTLKSASGRFVAVGTNVVAMFDLLKWADGVAAQLGRTLELKPLTEQPLIRIALPAVAAGGAGGLTSARTPSGWVLTVPDYAATDVAAATRTLVGVLLDAYAVGEGGVTNVSGSVPSWFLSALLRNMDPVRREGDFEEVFNVWSAGRLPSMAEILASSGDGGNGAGTERPPWLDGVLLQWLLDMEPADRGIGAVMGRLISGLPLDASAMLTIRHYGTAVDLDVAWDDWLLKRRWVVVTLGRATPWIAQRLRVERLIYTADSGIPAAVRKRDPLSLEDLITYRKTRWAANAAAAKDVSLRVLAAGRGREVGGVVAAYARFFDAVRDRRSEAELRRLLEAADRALEGLDVALKESSHEGEEHAGGQRSR